MDFFDSFPFTRLQGKNRGLDWVMQKIAEFQKAVDNIPEAVKSLTAKDLGAAPAGYGLGEHSKYTADCHTITENGWYYTDTATLNMPPHNSAYAVIIAKTRGNNLVLEMTEVVSGAKAQCYKNGDVWSVWEFENPPMLPGVEYRTTGRFNGKPVYTKLINCQAMSTSGRMPVHIGYLGKVIRYAGNCGVGALPYRDPDANGTIDMAVEIDYVIFNVNVTEEKQAVLGTAYAQLWYIKD